MSDILSGLVYPQLSYRSFAIASGPVSKGFFTAIVEVELAFDERDELSSGLAS